MSKLVTILDRAGGYLTLGGLTLIVISVAWPILTFLMNQASHGKLFAIGCLLLIAAGVLAILHSIAKSFAKNKAN